VAGAPGPLREPGTFPTARKGPDHYLSWEVVAYNATLVDVYEYMPQEQCCRSGSARIRIILPDPDPHPKFFMPDPDPADPDPSPQKWHLINLFSVEKYCE
jgi:hypothetical protein